MLEFWSLDNSSSKSILDVLETIYLKFRKTIVQRVTVVKYGVYNGGGNCFCGVNVKVGTDTAESTNVNVKKHIKTYCKVSWWAVLLLLGFPVSIWRFHGVSNPGHAVRCVGPKRIVFTTDIGDVRLSAAQLFRPPTSPMPAGLPDWVTYRESATF